MQRRSGGGRWFRPFVRATDELQQFRDILFQQPGLGIEILGGIGTFLGAGGVGLRDFIELGDSDTDLPDATRLFL